jgi:DNA repair protein RadC
MKGAKKNPTPSIEAALSDAELVATLIAEAEAGPALLVAEALLQGCRLAALPTATREILQYEGLAEGQATRLLAASELARRLAREEVAERKLLASSEALARYLTLRYRRRDQEVMGAVFLDTQHRFLSEVEAYRGTLRRATVEPREILRESLLRGAAGVVLFHTHPSGDPTPSREDVAFTRRIAAASEAVGVDLLDHLVLGSPGRYVSLKERGLW